MQTGYFVRESRDSWYELMRGSYSGVLCWRCRMWSVVVLGKATLAPHREGRVQGGIRVRIREGGNGRYALVWEEGGRRGKKGRGRG